MSSHTINLTDTLHEYLLRVGSRESEVAKELRAETLHATRAHPMQISPEQGAFMQLLVRLIGARQTLEVGTFTGYSALVVAEALPATSPRNGPRSANRSGNAPASRAASTCVCARPQKPSTR